MLKVFRENLKQWHWVLWLVIVVFVLLVFVDFGGARLQGDSPDDAVASVGARSVSLASFQRHYSNLEDQIRSTYGDAYNRDLAKQLQLPQRALNDLINEEILILEAEHLGLEPSPEEIRAEILEMAAFRDENGRFVGTERYRRILTSARMTVSEFEQNVRRQVLVRKLVDVLMATAFVADADVERRARDETEQASIRYLQVLASQLAGEIAIGEDELASYFAEHQGEYRIPEQRLVSYLSVNVNTIRANLEVEEERLRAYYDESQEEFTQEEQVRARHILLFAGSDRTPEEAKSQIESLKRRIEAGEDFATLATELSEDQGSKARGGDLGYFGRGRMTPAFEDAAFAAGPGTLVGPVENALGNRTGYHLIEVLDHRPGGLQSFEAVENRIRVRLLNELAQEEAESRARALAGRLAAEQPADDEALGQLAEAEAVAFETTEPFARSDSPNGLGPTFSAAAFELEPGVYSEPVRVPAGWAVLVLREVIDTRLPELAEVEEEVHSNLEQEKEVASARSRLEEIRQELAASSERSLDDLAAELGVEVRDGGQFARGGTVAGLGAAEAIVEKALELEAGDLGGPVETAQGLVLFEITDRQYFDPEAFAQSKESEREELAEEQINTLLSAVIAQRRQELEVDLAPWFVESFELAGAGGVAQL
jgi:peptidyl-prolyl cis-trans isomerase D